MSITTLSSDHTADKIIYNNNKKSFHHRNDSADELDVFEAARYFSGYNNEAAAGYHCGSTYNNSQKMREDHHRQAWRGGRVSLDLPMIREPVVLAHHQHQHQHLHQEKQLMNNNIKEKKCKQPSSPGGRLASFLNSLFNQSSSKKKKSKSMKDIHEEESPGGGRRKRRSSISHFRSSSNTTTTTTTTTDSKSLYSSSSSGFRTPPPYAHTPTKSYKDFRSYSDHHKLLKQVVKPAAAAIQNENINKDLSWLDEKFKIIDAYSSDQKHKYSSHEEKDYRSSKLINENINIIDDGAESDSSSDLFELQNYDLGIYSNGLPVYETTHMDNIKRSGAPISNGAL